MPHHLRTPRLVLRPAGLRGARDLWLEVRAWPVLRNTSLWPYPLSYAQTVFMLKDAGQPDDDNSHLFYIITPEGLAGTMGLHHRSRGVMGLGYMIGVRFWGKGYATEAARAISRFGFRQLRAQSILAEVYTDNPGSEKVLRNVGFQRRDGTRIGYSAARQQRLPITTWDLTRGMLRS